MDTTITYKGFCEDNTKAESLQDIEIEFLLCTFEEAIRQCRQNGISEARFKTSDFETIKKMGVADYDIHIECRNISGRSLWVGNFSTQDKKFKVFAEAN
jgi:hypothetical protein